MGNHEILERHESETVAELVYPDESYAVQGALFGVYSVRGCGFLEAVYQTCLAIEFRLRDVPFVSKPKLELAYKGHSIDAAYEPDFVCFGKIIVELTAVSKLANEHRAQVQNYLRATNTRLGILANFGHFPKLEYERILL